jgi:transcriptional regulator with XRE-family HTH domain
MRNARGWTQQHLADACDISLRTVQRVEKYGTASNETIMGLCAVFEIDARELSVVPKYNEAALEPVKVKDFGVFIGLAGVGGFILGVGTVWVFLQF